MFAPLFCVTWPCRQKNIFTQWTLDVTCNIKCGGIDRVPQKCWSSNKKSRFKVIILCFKNNRKNFSKYVFFQQYPKRKFCIPPLVLRKKISNKKQDSVLPSYVVQHHMKFILAWSRSIKIRENSFTAKRLPKNSFIITWGYERNYNRHFHSLDIYSHILDISVSSIQTTEARCCSPARCLSRGEILKYCSSMILFKYERNCWVQLKKRIFQ